MFIDLEFIAGLVTNVIGLLGVLAFMVSVIVQVTKGFIPKKMPTDIYVMVISLIVTYAAMFILSGVQGVKFEVYVYVLAAFMSFIVSFISMNGWEKLKQLWDRFDKNQKMDAGEMYNQMVGTNAITSVLEDTDDYDVKG